MIKRIALLMLLLVSVTVNLGAFTRLVDAGLGCPDWPTCYGHALWPTTSDEIASANQQYPEAKVDTTKTWPEMIHRYFASSVGLFAIALVVLCWRKPLSKLTLSLLFVVCVQGAFGAWTVTLKLWPQVVTLHLLGGFLTLSLVWILLQRLYYAPWPDRHSFKKLRLLAPLGLLVIILQIALGGWTSSNYAALACTDFPTCHGSMVPDLALDRGFDISQDIGPNYLGGQLDNQARVTIHFMHRVGALITTLVVLIVAGFAWKTGLDYTRRWAVWAVAGLAIQVALGLTNIFAMLPLSIAVAHNAGGAVLLLIFVTLNYRLFSQPKHSVVQAFNEVRV